MVNANHYDAAKHVQLVMRPMLLLVGSLLMTAQLVGANGTVVHPEVQMGNVPATIAMGEPIHVSVTGTNFGPDTSARSDFQISFPDLGDRTSITRMDGDGAVQWDYQEPGFVPYGCNYKAAGDQLGGCAALHYLNVDGQFGAWPSGVSHTINIDVYPAHPGTFRVQAKLVLYDGSGAEAAPAQGPMDQQGEFVVVAKVDVTGASHALPTPIAPLMVLVLLTLASRRRT